MVELSGLEQNNESTLLDLYSGCGAMSTGLCLGANSCGVKLITVSFKHLVIFYLLCYFKITFLFVEKKP